MHGIESLPRFACPDWWERIQAGRTPMADVPVNEVKAAKALAFFNRLRLPDVPGTPTLREACGDWFRDILVAFLASEDPETGRRLVWELLCMVPKKKYKSHISTCFHLQKAVSGRPFLLRQHSGVALTKSNTWRHLAKSGGSRTRQGLRQQ